MRNPVTAAQAELAFPGTIAQGARGSAAKRLQEWLSFHRFNTPVDGAFGDATAVQLAAFQSSVGASQQATLTNDVWDQLVAPLSNALAPITIPTGATLPDVVLAVARQHSAARPLEIGGQNSGPWVRAYMDGNEGSEYPWCAGFATFVIASACNQLGVSMPVLRTYSCDSLAVDARNHGRLIASKNLDWQAMGACLLFLVQRTPNDWIHTGFAFAVTGQTFSTIEGNSNDSGSNEGYEVCERQRSLNGKSLIRLDDLPKQ
jgi:hypothetical protein